MTIHLSSSIISSGTSRAKKLYNWLSPTKAQRFHFQSLGQYLSERYSSLPFLIRRRPNSQLGHTLKRLTIQLLSLTGSLSTIATLMEANVFSFTLLLVFQCSQTWILMPDNKKKEIVRFTQKSFWSYTKVLTINWLALPNLLITGFNVDFSLWSHVPYLPSLWTTEAAGTDDERHPKPSRSWSWNSNIFTT